jgi:hypothetical protein
MAMLTGPPVAAFTLATPIQPLEDDPAALLVKGVDHRKVATSALQKAASYAWRTNDCVNNGTYGIFDDE